MKTFGRTLLIAAALFALGGIWITALWWQLLLTGVLLLTAAAILGNQTPPSKNVRRRHPLALRDEDYR